MVIYPEIKQLWQGTMLATIAHSIWIAYNPYFSHEMSWDGLNYSIQDSMGARGTVTFQKERLVGVFFDNTSNRNPFKSSKDYKLDTFFIGAPPEIVSLAQEEALQYILQEYQGVVMPIVTTVFWGVDKYLSAAEPWQSALENGAHLLRIHFLDTEIAIEEYETGYELSADQLDLLRSLFSRKMTRPNVLLPLKDRDITILGSKGNSGISESIELLSGIGFFVP